MSRITQIGENELAKWDRLVYHHIDGNIYQTSAWRKVVENSFGHQPVYFAIKNASGEIEAALPFFTIKSKAFGNRLTSLPCAQACNPLVSNPGEYELLFNFVERYIKKQNIPYAELKTTPFKLQDATSLGKPFTGYSTYTLDLSRDITTIEKSLHKNCIRRAINKANKVGLKLITGNSLKDVKIFYNLYLKMRKEYGLLPQPYKFFVAMWDVLHPQKHIEIMHAKYEDEIISSLILLKYKDHVIYEYGASRSDRVHLKPSPFLLWETIKRSKEEGYLTFDFGRTANDNEGLSTFKKRWNTKQEVLHYYYLPDLGGFNSMRQKGLAKKVMYHAIKHSPESVCQFMGQLLYKNFV